MYRPFLGAVPLRVASFRSGGPTGGAAAGTLRGRFRPGSLSPLVSSREWAENLPARLFGAARVRGSGRERCGHPGSTRDLLDQSVLRNAQDTDFVRA